MSSQIEINKQTINYLQSQGYRSDPVVDNLVNETEALGDIAKMQISAEQGKFLEIITKIIKAKNCLEIGRFTGLSALCIARGLSNKGNVYTVDNSDEFLPLAKKYWQEANVVEKIKSVIGNGLEVMQSYLDRQYAFDLIFIDADKNNYINYYELSLLLISSNGLIIFDNMLWGGNVADISNNDNQTKTIRELNQKIKNDKRVEFSLLPMSDGLSLIRKK